MKPRAEGFTNEAMAAILSSHCERNLGGVQTPVGTGDLGGPKLFFFYQILSVLFGDVVVQFYPWFNCYFLLFLGMVICDNEFEISNTRQKLRN